MKGRSELNSILYRWRLKHYLIALTILLVALVIGFVLKENLNYSSAKSLVVILLSMSVLGFLFYYFKPKSSDLITLINQQVKDVEHSTHLLEKSDTDLNTLQRIQKSKVATAIGKSKLQLPLNTTPAMCGSSIVGLCLLSLFLFFSGEPTKIKQIETIESSEQAKTTVTPRIVDSLAINNISIKVTPPSYTQLKSYYTKDLSLNIPELTQVQWRFDISGIPDQKEIIFEDTRIENLSAANTHTDAFVNSSFYNYRFSKEGQKEIISDYFPIKIIEDQSPKVAISGVEEYQRLEYKENYDVTFNINASDDYSLTNMFVSATLAKGTGESVKFREKQIELKDFQEGSKSYNGDYTFSTKELEMEPGDELYFYVAAKDNCPFENHWSKSTTHFVVLEDTAQVTLVDAGGMQLDIMPDFFRSQRQIIIDTEQLISEKDTLPIEIFKQRSNDLGYDQKLLRLKYGQFLGEESESGLDFENDVDMDLGDEEHDHTDPNHSHADDGSEALNDARSLIEQFMHDHDHEEEANQLLETKGTEKIEEAKNPQWVKDMSHSHDNTEEATFFDVSIKGKLRAALNGMWDSELHLRLADPEKALPFQYTSLGYLDEIKNHSRAYVQRIGFEPPVIKEQEKRLTGNLKEVYSTRDILKAEVKDNITNIKAALPLLLDLQQKLKISFSKDELRTLQKAGGELSGIAIKKSEYLPVLSNLRSLITDPQGLNELKLNTLIQAFIKIIPSEKREAIAAKYFRHPINMKVVSEFKKTR